VYSLFVRLWRFCGFTGSLSRVRSGLSPQRKMSCLFKVEMSAFMDGRGPHGNGANHFLEMRFVPEWELRFTVAPRKARNAHRQLGRAQHLEEILRVRVARRVAQDHTVSWDGNRWGVLREVKEE
jgi:hypothetical protein